MDIVAWIEEIWDFWVYNIYEKREKEVEDQKIWLDLPLVLIYGSGVAPTTFDITEKCARIIICVFIDIMLL